jgi:integrase
VADTWLPHHATRVRPSTLKRDEQLVRVHVVPLIGGMRLSAIRPLHVQKVVDGVAAKDRSAGTQVLVYRVLASSLAQALRWQLIAVNPAKAIRPPRPERPMLNTPDVDQMVRILDVARDSWIEKPVLLSSATGMRLGETLAVRWVDLDLERGVVRVTRALDRDFRFSQPKSARSRRTINLPAFAIDALRRWKREQNERRLVVGEAWADHDLVVDNGLGAPLRVDSVSSAFATMMRRAEIEPPPRFHDLRHGFATRLLEAGVHPKVVSEALGHASVAFTMDRYQHVMPSMQAQAADAIQAALADGP